MSDRQRDPGPHTRMPGDMEVTREQLQLGDLVLAIGHRGNCYGSVGEVVLLDLKGGRIHTQHEMSLATNRYSEFSTRPVYIRGRGDDRYDPMFMTVPKLDASVHRRVKGEDLLVGDVVMGYVVPKPDGSLGIDPYSYPLLIKSLPSSGGDRHWGIEVRHRDDAVMSDDTITFGSWNKRELWCFPKGRLSSRRVIALRWDRVRWVRVALPEKRPRAAIHASSSLSRTRPHAGAEGSYPHSCPGCGGRAYIGFMRVEHDPKVGSRDCRLR